MSTHTVDIQSLALLQQNPWFAAIPTTLASVLLEAGKLRQLHKGEVVYAKGDAPSAFYCILSGRVKLSNVTRQGKELVLTWFEQAHWFGEVSLFDHLPRTHDATADIDTTLFVLPLAILEQKLNAYPQLYPYFMRLLCDRIRTIFDTLHDNGSLSTKGQLAKRLILLATGMGQVTVYPEEQQKGQQQGQKKQQSPIAANVPLTPANERELSSTLKVTVSQDSLAKMMQLSRQTINKLLKELQAAKLVQVKYGRVEIIDLSGLEKLD